MNKILIPSILTATILIAAAFAVIDVDRAMAGHLPSIGAVTSANIGTGVIITDDLADNAVDAAKATGSNAQDSPFRLILDGSAASLTQQTTAYTPADAVNILLTCSLLITENASGAISDGTLALTIDTGGGAISGDADVLIPDIITSKSDIFERTWHITGNAATAQQFTCTVGGTIVAAEVISIDTITLFVPQ